MIVGRARTIGVHDDRLPSLVDRAPRAMARRHALEAQCDPVPGAKMQGRERIQ
jgi:hypothetical protein